MVLVGEAAIGRLDGLLVGRALDAEHFVVIAFFHEFSGLSVSRCDRASGI